MSFGGDLIRESRRRVGLSQTALAERLGVVAPRCAHRAGVVAAHRGIRVDALERRLVDLTGRELGATVQVGDTSVDLRIASLPTSFGERVVVRFLDKGARLYTLNELGMETF